VSDDPSLADGAGIDVTAAELALGLLDGEERAAALRRVLAEPAFAAEVERWRLYFAQLFDLWPEVEPPEELIDRIDLSLGGPGAAGVGGRSRRLPWPLLAIASSALAAALLVVVAIRPAAPPPAPPRIIVRTRPVPARPVAGPLLLAALGDTKIPAAYEPATGRLRVAGAPAVASGKTPELWVIGSDAVPHALGLLTRSTNDLILADADRPRLVAGATLAVSVEPAGGSTTGLPTGPVVATGALSAV
jgi:anti-sigma-K factor RskA